MTQLKAFKFTFLALILLFFIGMLYWFTNVMSYMEEEITMDQLIHENNKDYLYLDGWKLKISANSMTHFDFEEDYTYKITYSYNKLISNKGEVERIEVYGGPLPK